MIKSVHVSQRLHSCSYLFIMKTYAVHLILNNIMGHAGLKWGYVQLATRAQACFVGPQQGI